MTAIVTDSHFRMAVSLIRDLGEAGVNVIACVFDNVPANPGFASKYVSRKVTFSRENYEEELFSLCKELHDSGEKAALLPVGAGTLAMLSERAERFRGVCGLAVPTTDELCLYNDKVAVGRMADSLGIPTPRKCTAENGDVEKLAAAIKYPAVVKPACGEKFGLKAEARYKIIRTPVELTAAYQHFFGITGEAPIVEEYLAGGGVGCSVLCDRGQVVAHICHRRVREYPVSGGPSSCSEVIDEPALVEMASKFVASTGYTGLAMFEFKAGEDGVFRLLEINPRVWGTYPLTRASGSNFSLLWCSLAAGEHLPEYIPPTHTRMVYYPSDLAAMLGYLKGGCLAKFFGGVKDLLSPRVKNGLAERGDRGPSREYFKSLKGRGRG